MNREDRDRTVEMIQLGIHEYFDHYLTDVFPRQMDRCFDAHNSDSEAHKGAIQRVNRGGWMIAGMSALIGFASLIGAVTYYWLLIRSH